MANAICPDDRYVRIASGRDYLDAAPIKGLTSAMPTADGKKPERDRLSIALSVRALATA